MNPRDGSGGCVSESERWVEMPISKLAVTAHLASGMVVGSAITCEVVL